MLDRFKQFWQGVMLAPFINLFIRLGVSPDVVTLVGTLGVSFGALFFFAQGWVWQGVLFITAFVFSDLVDGAMARKIGRKDDFGAFLDSASPTARCSAGWPSTSPGTPTAASTWCCAWSSSSWAP